MSDDKKTFSYNFVDINVPINTKKGLTIQPPLGKNSVSSLSVLYEDREYYSDFVIPFVDRYVGDKKVFCDLLRENALYGLIDNNLNCIISDEVFMKEIPSGDDKPKFVMDFVADAFLAMNSYLSTAVMLGKMSNKSPFYNLKAYRAYINQKIFINSIKEEYAKNFKTYLLNNFHLASKVKDIKSFNKIFIHFVRENLKKGLPVTKTSTFLSTNFSNFISGLIIDIAQDSADNDFNKFNKYFSDKSFSIFADACKRFGFLIDKNIPWRIVADLNSPAMKDRVGDHTGFMVPYGINGMENLFQKRFLPVFQDELFYLKELFYYCYTSLIKDYPYYETDYKKLDICDFKNQTVFKRDNISKDNFLKSFKDGYWIRVLTYFRNYEEQRNLSQQEFENIVREASNFITAKQTQQALVYVNEYFKQFKNVHYFSTLQPPKQEVQHRATTNALNELIF